MEQRTIPGDWPQDAGAGAPFDLIVLSELLYYLSDEDLARTVGRAVDSLAPDGTLLAVHWRRPVAFHPQTGDQAHAALAARPELTLRARPPRTRLPGPGVPAGRAGRGLGGGRRGPDMTSTDMTSTDMTSGRASAA